MKIWHISDTHENAHKLIIPKNIDIVIHSGDAASRKDPYQNEPGLRGFLEWYGSLNISHKIYVAGNHDTSLAAGVVTRKDIESKGIIYLHNESVKVAGLNIWGSPFVSQYGEWAYMCPPEELKDIWEEIPEDTDIVVTHSPPLGMLDLTHDSYVRERGNYYRQCGCEHLAKKIDDVSPILHCFGHIHNSEPGTAVINTGIKSKAGSRTIYSNGTCSTDGMWGEITNHGNIIDI
jgi:Icc-related predicted phosphoesterase